MYKITWRAQKYLIGKNKSFSVLLFNVMTNFLDGLAKSPGSALRTNVRNLQVHETGKHDSIQGGPERMQQL